MDDRQRYRHFEALLTDILESPGATDISQWTERLTPQINTGNRFLDKVLDDISGFIYEDAMWRVQPSEQIPLAVDLRLIRQSYRLTPQQLLTFRKRLIRELFREDIYPAPFVSTYLAGSPDHPYSMIDYPGLSIIEERVEEWLAQH